MTDVELFPHLMPNSFAGPLHAASGAVTTAGHVLCVGGCVLRLRWPRPPHAPVFQPVSVTSGTDVDKTRPTIEPDGSDIVDHHSQRYVRHSALIGRTEHRGGQRLAQPSALCLIGNQQAELRLVGVESPDVGPAQGGAVVAP